MAHPLTIDIAHQPGQVTFTLTGELDAATTDTLARALAAIDPGAGRIRLDLANVTFLDSSGINLLLRTHRDLAVDLRELIIANPSDQVLHVLGVVGLTDVLHLT